MRVAIDPAGNAYIAGDTQSSNLQTAGAVQAVNGGSGDPFVAKINAAGSAVAYSQPTSAAPTRMPPRASRPTRPATRSSPASRPRSTVVPDLGLDATPNGGNDAILVKLDPSGSSRLYAGYLGGSG